MGKKKVTLSIESKTYDDFQKYCNENAIMLSRKIEIAMNDIMREKRRKKMMFLIFMCLFMLLPLASAATIYSDNFEDGDLAGWSLTTAGGANAWTNAITDPQEGSRHASAQPSSTSEPASVMEETVSTVGYNNITIKYYRKLVGIDAADEFQMEWNNGGGWTILEQSGGSGVDDANYVYKEFNLSSSADNNANLQIKFECTAGAVSEFCRVDNIIITGNVIDVTMPTFSGYVENPVNNTAYVSGATYRFNVTVTETSVGRVGIEFNGTNYTLGNITNSSNVYMFNRTNLAAGTYNYYWWANDTNGNYNTSGIRSYTVAKANPDVRMYLNGARSSLTIGYGAQSNATASANIFGIVLYRNSVDVTSENSLNRTLAAGYYNYTAFHAGNQNYSSGTETFWLNITNATGNISLLLNGNANNLTVQYPQQTNISAATLYGSVTLYKDGTAITSENSLNVTRGGGYYNITAVSSGDANHSSASVTYWLNITKASRVVNLNFNPVSPVTYGVAVNASCTTTSTEGNLNLFRNGNDVTSNELGKNATLGAGTHNYACNVSATQNYSFAENTSSYTIDKAIGNVSLLLNGVASTLNINYPQQVNASAATLYGSVTLYKEGGDVTSTNARNVTLGAGYYNYTAVSSGNANYTAASLTYFANVSKGNIIVTLLLNGAASNLSVVYLNNVNASASVSGGTLSLYRDGVDITGQNAQNNILGAGYYEYRVNATGNENYSDNSAGKLFYANVTKATPNASMSISLNPSNNEDYGTSTTAAATESNGGDSDLTYRFYRNNTLIASAIPWEQQFMVLGAGSYNYYFNTSGGQNYSSGSVNATLLINKASNDLVLLINGNADNLTLEYPQQVNVSATSTSGVLSLFRNGSTVTSQNGLNVTLLPGYYEYFVNSSGNANYSANQVGIRLYVNVTPAPDSTAPVVSIVSPSDGSTFGTNISLALNYSIVEDNLQSCWYRIDSGNNISLSNCLNITFNTSAGSHTVFVYANDTNGNVGTGNSSFSIQIGAPAISISFPASGSYLNFVNISFAYTASDINLQSCELWGNFDGTFSRNQTNTTLVSGILSRFNLNLNDGSYLWGISCNDTVGNRATSANRTFVVDTVNPDLILSAPSGSYSSLSGIPLTFSASDSSPMACTYNVMKGASFEIANTSIDCISTSFDVSGEGNYIIEFYLNDSAGNSNYTSSSFSVSLPVECSGGDDSGGGGGGGGGGGCGFLPRNASKEVKLNLTVEDINIKQGSREEVKLEAVNTGKVFLNNCKLKFLGDSAGWMSNSQLKGLSTGEKFVYSIIIDVTGDTEPDNYPIDITLECDEGAGSTNMMISVYRNTFEGDILTYVKDGGNLKVSYSLKENAGIEHEIFLDYTMTTLDGILRYKGQTNTKLEPMEAKEEDLEFKLPKDSFGEFDFKIEFNDGLTVIDTNRTIFLPSGFSTTGLSISDTIKNRLSVLGIFLVSLALLFFVVRFLYKHHTKSKTVYGHGLKVRKLIKLEM